MPIYKNLLVIPGDFPQKKMVSNRGIRAAYFQDQLQRFVEVWNIFKNNDGVDQKE